MSRPTSISSKWGFIAAVVVLSLAAVGLNGATQFLKLHFKKQAVALPNKDGLKALPPTIGHWVQVSIDEKLDKETAEVLGTDEYIFRDYINTSITGTDILDQFKGKSSQERKQLVQQIELQHPEAVINVAVTYYTGLVDTVAHIPDRCYIADGYEPTEYTEPTWDLGKDKNGKDRSIGVRFINFEDQSGVRQVPKSVAYFFQVNGDWVSDPLAVRRRLQNLLEKYGYYAKVELLTLVRDREVSASVMKDFLSSGLPQIEQLLPDWERVKRGQADSNVTVSKSAS